MEKSLFRQVAVLASGTVVAQAITFGFSLILARIYSSEAFGYFTAFVGIVSILTILGAGSYDKALMFARSSRRMTSVIALVAGLGLGVAATVSIAGLVTLATGTQLPFGLSYVDLIVLLPLGIGATICSQLAVYGLLKSDNANAISFAKVVQASVGGAAQTSGALFNSPKCLVVGYLLGLTAFVHAFWRNLSHLFRARSRRLRLSIVASAVKYRRYPLYVCPNELLDVVSNQIPLLLIGWFFSLATLGQYGFAQRILAGPAALVGQAVGQVFFKRISHDHLAASDTKGLIFRVWLLMAAIGSVPFLTLFLYGDVIFTFVFGGEWAEAGRIAELLAPLLFLRFVSSPTSTIYYRLNLQRAQLMFAMAAFAVRAGPFLLAGSSITFTQLLLMQVVGEVVVIIAFNVVGLARVERLRLQELRDGRTD